jgi:hypothetical protein
MTTEEIHEDKAGSLGLLPGDLAETLFSQYMQ